MSSCGKYFKKMIADMKNFTDKLTIEKNGASGNLMFTYSTEDQNIKATSIPTNTKKIEMKSSIEEGDIFSVSVYLTNVKPISASNLAEFIYVKASKEYDLLFHTYLDEGAITVAILTEIINYKPAV